MDFMYIKYKNKKRHSIIKNGDNILNTDSTIIPLKQKELKNPSSISNPFSNIKNNTTVIPVIELKKYNSSHDNDKNDEITNFFLNAIHRNYLRNKK